MSATPRIDLASVTRLTELADYIVPFTIRVMCDLAVADHLVEGPLPVDVLARRIGADPAALTRGCARWPAGASSPRSNPRSSGSPRWPSRCAATIPSRYASASRSCRRTSTRGPG
ncbi:hypothetical protein GCM10027614_09090 [Micromonospora vulcania]